MPPVYITEIDDAAIQELGNAFVDLGNQLYTYSTGLTDHVEGTDWTGTARDKAVAAWQSIMTSPVTPVANEMVAVGQAIQDFAQQVRDARAQQQRAYVAEIIIGVIGILLIPLSFAIGPALSAIARVVGQALAALVRVTMPVLSNAGRVLTALTVGVPRVTSVLVTDLVYGIQNAARTVGTAVPRAAPVVVNGSRVAAIGEGVADVVLNAGANIALTIAPDVAVRKAMNLPYDGPNGVDVLLAGVMGATGSAGVRINDGLVVPRPGGPLIGHPPEVPVVPPRQLPDGSIVDGIPPGTVTLPPPPKVDLSLPPSGPGQAPKLNLDPPAVRPGTELTAPLPATGPPRANLTNDPVTSASAVRPAGDLSSTVGVARSAGDGVPSTVNRPGQVEARLPAPDPSTNAGPRPRVEPADLRQPGTDPLSLSRNDAPSSGKPPVRADTPGRTETSGRTEVSGRADGARTDPADRGGTASRTETSPTQTSPTQTSPTQTSASSRRPDPMSTGGADDTGPTSASSTGRVDDPAAHAADQPVNQPLHEAPAGPDPLPVASGSQPPPRPTGSELPGLAPLKQQYRGHLDLIEQGRDYLADPTVQAKGWANRADGAKVLGLDDAAWAELNVALTEHRLNPGRQTRELVLHQLNRHGLDPGDLDALSSGLERGVRPSELAKLNADRAGLGLEPVTADEATLILHPDPEHAPTAQLVKRPADHPLPEVGWWLEKPLTARALDNVNARRFELMEAPPVTGRTVGDIIDQVVDVPALWRDTGGPSPVHDNPVMSAQTHAFDMAYLTWRVSRPNAPLSMNGVAHVHTRWEQMIAAQYRDHVLNPRRDGLTIEDLIARRSNELPDAFTREAKLAAELGSARETFDAFRDLYYRDMDGPATERVRETFTADFRVEFERNGWDTVPWPERRGTLLDDGMLLDRFIAEEHSNRALSDARTTFTELVAESNKLPEVLEPVGADFREDYLYQVRDPLYGGGRTKSWLDHEYRHENGFGPIETRADAQVRAYDTALAAARQAAWRDNLLTVYRDHRASHPTPPPSFDKGTVGWRYDVRHANDLAATAMEQARAGSALPHVAPEQVSGIGTARGRFVDDWVTARETLSGQALVDRRAQLVTDLRQRFGDSYANLHEAQLRQPGPVDGPDADLVFDHLAVQHPDGTHTWLTHADRSWSYDLRTWWKDQLARARTDFAEQFHALATVEPQSFPPARAALIDEWTTKLGQWRDLAPAAFADVDAMPNARLSDELHDAFRAAGVSEFPYAHELNTVRQKYVTGALTTADPAGLKDRTRQRFDAVNRAANERVVVEAMLDDALGGTVAVAVKQLRYGSAPLAEFERLVGLERNELAEYLSWFGPLPAAVEELRTWVFHTGERFTVLADFDARLGAFLTDRIYTSGDGRYLLDSATAKAVGAFRDMAEGWLVGRWGDGRRLADPGRYRSELAWFATQLRDYVRTTLLGAGQPPEHGTTEVADALQRERLAGPPLPMDCLVQLTNLDERLVKAGLLAPRPLRVLGTEYLEAAPAQRFAMDHGQDWRQAGRFSEIGDLLAGTPGSVAYLTSGPPNQPTHAFALINDPTKGLLWVDVTAPHGLAATVPFQTHSAPVDLADLRYLAFGPDRTPLLGGTTGHHVGVSGLLLAPTDYRPGTRGSTGQEPLAETQSVSVVSLEEFVVVVESPPVTEEFVVVVPPPYPVPGSSLSWADMTADFALVHWEKYLEFDADPSPGWVRDVLDVVLRGVRQGQGSTTPGVLVLAAMTADGLVSTFDRSDLLAGVSTPIGDVVASLTVPDGAPVTVLSVNNAGPVDPAVLGSVPSGTRFVDIADAFRAGLAEVDPVRWPELVQRYVDFVGERGGLVYQPPLYVGLYGGLGDGQIDADRMYTELGDLAERLTRTTSLSAKVARAVATGLLSPHYLRDLGRNGKVVGSGSGRYELGLSWGPARELTQKLGPLTPAERYRPNEVNFTVAYGVTSRPRLVQSASERKRGYLPALSYRDGVFSASATARAGASQGLGQAVSAAAEYAATVKSFQAQGFFEYAEAALTVRLIGSNQPPVQVPLGRPFTVWYLKETLVPDLTGLVGPELDPAKLDPGTVDTALDGVWKKVTSVDLASLRSMVLDHYGTGGRVMDAETLQEIAAFVSERMLKFYPRDLTSGALRLSVRYTANGVPKVDHLTLTLVPPELDPTTYTVDRLTVTVQRVDAFTGGRVDAKSVVGSDAELAGSGGVSLGAGQGRVVTRGIAALGTTKNLAVSGGALIATKHVLEMDTDVVFMHNTSVARITVVRSGQAPLVFRTAALTFVASGREDVGSTGPIALPAPDGSGVALYSAVPSMVGVTGVEKVFGQVLDTVWAGLHEFPESARLTTPQRAAMEAHFADHFLGSAVLTSMPRAVDGGLPSSYRIGDYLVYVNVGYDVAQAASTVKPFGGPGSAVSHTKMTMDSSAKYTRKIDTRSVAEWGQRIGFDTSLSGGVGTRFFRLGMSIASEFSFGQSLAGLAGMAARGNRRIKMGGSGVRSTHAAVLTVTVNVVGDLRRVTKQNTYPATVLKIGRVDSDRVDPVDRARMMADDAAALAAAVHAADGGVDLVAVFGEEAVLPPGTTPLVPAVTSGVAPALEDLLGFTDRWDVAGVEARIALATAYGQANAVAPYSTTYLGTFTDVAGRKVTVTVRRRLFQPSPVTEFRDPVTARANPQLGYSSQFSGGPEDVKDATTQLTELATNKVNLTGRVGANATLGGSPEATTTGSQSNDYTASTFADLSGQGSVTVWNKGRGSGLNTSNRRAAKNGTDIDLYRFHTVFEITAVRQQDGGGLTTVKAYVTGGPMDAAVLRTESLLRADTYHLPMPALTGSVAGALAGNWVDSTEATRRYEPATMATGQSLGLGDVFEIGNADGVLPAVLGMLDTATGQEEAWNLTARHEGRLANLLDADALRVMAPYLGANGTLTVLVPRHTWYGWATTVVTVTARIGTGVHEGTMRKKKTADSYAHGGDRVELRRTRGYGYGYSRGLGLSQLFGSRFGFPLRFGESARTDHNRTTVNTVADKFQDRVKITGTLEEFSHPWTFQIETVTVSSPPELLSWISLGQAGQIMTWLTNAHPEAVERVFLPGTLRLHVPTALTTTTPTPALVSSVTAVAVHRGRRRTQLPAVIDLTGVRPLLLEDLTVNRAMLTAAIRGAQNTFFRHHDRIPKPPYWLVPGTEAHLATEVAPAALLGLAHRLLSRDGALIPGLKHLLTGNPTVKLLPHAVSYLNTIEIANERSTEVVTDTEHNDVTGTGTETDHAVVKAGSDSDQITQRVDSDTVEHVHEDRYEGYRYLITSGTFTVTSSNRPTNLTGGPTTIDLTVTNAAVIILTRGKAEELGLPLPETTSADQVAPTPGTIEDVLAITSPRPAEPAGVNPATLSRHAEVLTVIVDVDATGTTHIDGTTGSAGPHLTGHIAGSTGWNHRNIILVPRDPDVLHHEAARAALRALGRHLHRGLGVDVLLPTHPGNLTGTAGPRTWRRYRADRGTWITNTDLAEAQQRLGGSRSDVTTVPATTTPAALLDGPGPAHTAQPATVLGATEIDGHAIVRHTLDGRRGVIMLAGPAQRTVADGWATTAASADTTLVAVDIHDGLAWVPVDTGDGTVEHRSLTADQLATVLGKLSTQGDIVLATPRSTATHADFARRLELVLNRTVLPVTADLSALDPANVFTTLPTHAGTVTVDRTFDWDDLESLPEEPEAGPVWSGLPGDLAEVMFTADVPLFRGDSRPPEVIFREGFTARGTNDDLIAYVELGADERADFAYIGTSRERSFSAGWIADGGGGWVYEIRAGGGIDLSKTRSNSYAEQEEVVFAQRIDPADIVGAWRVEAGSKGRVEGSFLPNPGTAHARPEVAWRAEVIRELTGQAALSRLPTGTTDLVIPHAVTLGVDMFGAEVSTARLWTLVKLLATRASADLPTAEDVLAMVRGLVGLSDDRPIGADRWTMIDNLVRC